MNIFFCLFVKCQEVKSFQFSNFVIVASHVLGKISFRNLMCLFSNLFVIFILFILLPIISISTIKFLANCAFLESFYFV